MRTLVVAPSWVGDSVLALPLLNALAASGRRVVALVRPHLEPLARLSPAIAEIVLRDPDDAASVERVREAGCQEAVILPNSFRSAWIPYRAGIEYRWGYTGNWRTPLLRPAVPRPGSRRGGRRHQSDDYRELAAALELEPPPSWVPRLALGEEPRRRGAERLARGHVPVGEGRIVGLYPGAEHGPAKRWPWQRFAALATELRRRVPGARAVILAGPKEVWMAVRVHEESGKIHPVIGPDLDLAGLAAVLAHLDLLVTNDTGPMHLAAALGVPCVALFGPTDPRRTAPAGSGHRVLYRDLWCSPCFRRRCPLVYHGCLRGIEVEEVAAACAAALA